MSTYANNAVDKNRKFFRRVVWEEWERGYVCRSHDVLKLLPKFIWELGEIKIRRFELTRCFVFINTVKTIESRF